MSGGKACKAPIFAATVLGDVTAREVLLISHSSNTTTGISVLPTLSDQLTMVHKQVLLLDKAMEAEPDRVRNKRIDVKTLSQLEPHDLTVFMNKGELPKCFTGVALPKVKTSSKSDQSLQHCYFVVYVLFQLYGGGYVADLAQSDAFELLRQENQQKAGTDGKTSKLTINTLKLQFTHNKCSFETGWTRKKLPGNDGKPTESLMCFVLNRISFVNNMATNRKSGGEERKWSNWKSDPEAVIKAAVATFWQRLVFEGQLLPRFDSEAQ